MRSRWEPATANIHVSFFWAPYMWVSFVVSNNEWNVRVRQPDIRFQKYKHMIFCLNILEHTKGPVGTTWNSQYFQRFVFPVGILLSFATTWRMNSIPQDRSSTFHGNPVIYSNRMFARKPEVSNWKFNSWIMLVECSSTEKMLIIWSSVNNEP